MTGKRLENKIAIITGGASGIGLATTRRFLAEGACVVVADIRANADEAAGWAGGDRLSCFRTDVSQEADIEAVVAHALERFGRVDCMFNNAGIPGVRASILSMKAAEFDRTLAVHLRGTFLGIKHAARVMSAQGHGSIICTGSIAALRAGVGTHDYSVAKAGIVQLTKSAAVELGESGVRVNCICPGFIPTGILGASLGLSARKSLELAERAASDFPASQPIRRSGTADDIAAAALWLASDESAFVTGDIMVVDGGFNAGSKFSDLQKSRRDRLARIGFDEPIAEESR